MLPYKFIRKFNHFPKLYFCRVSSYLYLKARLLRSAFLIYLHGVKAKHDNDKTTISRNKVVQKTLRWFYTSDAGMAKSCKSIFPQSRCMVEMWDEKVFLDL